MRQVDPRDRDAAGQTAVRLCAWLLIGVGVLGLWGCGELEPMVEPEIVDLQLTVDTLKTTVRETQRTVAELRGELDTRRQELAEAQVVRAQFEGRLREAERRVADSRHVIELQREELAAARAERERLSRSSLQLQSHMKQLQRQLSRLGKSAEEGQQDSASTPTNGAVRKARKAVMVPAQTEPRPTVLETGKQMATPAMMPPPAASPLPSEERPSTTSATHVSVKPGDTLWRIARTLRIDVDQLRALNQLTDDRIVIGQALRISGEEALPETGAVQAKSAP